jgi:hypothetical protein
MQIIFVARASFCAAPKPGIRAMQPEVARLKVGQNIRLRVEVDTRDRVEAHTFILSVHECPADKRLDRPTKSIAGSFIVQ